MVVEFINTLKEGENCFKSAILNTPDTRYFCVGYLWRMLLNLVFILERSNASVP